MTRTDAATAIAAVISASEDYAAKVWAQGGYVRVYVSTEGKDVGCVAVERNGDLALGSLGKGKHAVQVGRLVDGLGEVTTWRGQRSLAGVTDEFAGVAPSAPAPRGDANHEAQVRMGTLESFDR